MPGANFSRVFERRALSLFEIHKEEQPLGCEDLDEERNAVDRFFLIQMRGE